MEFDLEPFQVVIGVVPPRWAGSAMERGDLIPAKPVKRGDYNWGDAGMKVVKTGEVFPVGSWMQKGDLLSHSI